MKRKTSDDIVNRIISAQSARATGSETCASVIEIETRAVVLILPEQRDMFREKVSDTG